MDWTEEEKGTIEYYHDDSDWFYNGWFYGWFDNKSTPSFTEETKGTISWDEETKE